MDILTEHRDGEITVFTNNSTPEIHLTTRRAEAKEEVAENMGAVTTVADNMEEVKGAAKYAQTFDDVLLNLPAIIKAMPAAETAVKAKDDAISAKERAQESAEKAESAVVRAEEVTAEQVELAKGYAEQAKTEVSKVSSAFKIVGTVPTVEDLPKNAEVGNIYLVGDNSITNKPEYVWTSGGTWEKFGETVDLSAYQTKEEAETALAEKQDTLTAGEGIKIEGNVISTEGGKLPDNVYTADNLIAGKNVTFTEVPPEGGIDEHTLACWHFDGNQIDEVSGQSFSSRDYTYQIGKFGNSLYKGSSDNYVLSSNLLSSLNPHAMEEFTIDFWFSFDSSSSYVIVCTGDNATNKSNIYYAKISPFSILLSDSYDGGSYYDIKEKYTFPSTLTYGQYYHVALQAKNFVAKVFFDGKEVLSADFKSAGLSSTTTGFMVRGFVSKIDELRISDCVRYTESFTPPTRAYTVATGPSKTAVNAIVAVPTKTSELENDSGFLTGLPDNVYTQTNLLGGKDIEIVPEPVDGGIDEHTLACWHFTDSASDEVSGLVMATAQALYSGYSKFGEKSLKMLRSNGSSDISSLGLQPTKKSMTMDFWLYNHGSEWAVIRFGGSNTLMDIRIKKTGSMTFSGTLFESSISLSETIPVSFNHYAIQYDYENQEVSFYLNGKNLVKTKVPNVTLPVNGFDYLELSCYSSNSFISELRISDCVRYTEDFTPPTQPYRKAEPTGNMVVNFVGERLQKGADYVIESYNDGANWYRVYKSGWVEQGGHYSNDVNNSSNFNITLLKEMRTTLFYSNCVGTTVSSVLTVTEHTTTTVQFYYSNNLNNITASGFDWYVCGQGA